MFRILVPVDGSETSLRAITHLTKKLNWYKDAVEIHLLNVHHPVRQDVGMFVSHDQLEGFYHDEGIKALKAARDKLDSLGVQYFFHIGVGEPAHVIAEYAREKRCDQIVMGTHGHGVVAGLLLGSVTREVIHQSDVPVLLVK